MSEQNRRGERTVESADRERVLVDAAVAGDVQAFASLYDLHLERVYRHMYYLVGQRADAEDLTQQIFLQAWRAIGRYRRTGAPFIAWLLTIGDNLAANFFRRAKPTSPLDFDPAIEGHAVDPESAALASYDRQTMRRAILRLKPERGQVVLLRFVEGFEYSEIAAATGKSEGNVRVILHRALGDLRRLLDQEVRA